MPVTPFRQGFLRLWGVPPTPEEAMNNATVEQEKVNQVQAKEDARYDAMTEEQREKYYVKPGPLTKLKKFFRGQ
jgi:hypothetical protein